MKRLLDDDVLSSAAFIGLMLILCGAMLLLPASVMLLAPILWPRPNGHFLTAVVTISATIGTAAIPFGFGQWRYAIILRYVLKEARRRGEALTECRAHSLARTADVLGWSMMLHFWDSTTCKNSRKAEMTLANRESPMRTITLHDFASRTHFPDESTDGTVRNIEAMVLAGIMSLVRFNRAYLLDRRDCPKLYESGVRLKPETEGRLLDIAQILRESGADVDSLVAWRCAELRAAGVLAKPYLQKSPDGQRYRLLVLMPDLSTEDVAERIGA